MSDLLKSITVFIGGGIFMLSLIAVGMLTIAYLHGACTGLS